MITSEQWKKIEEVKTTIQSFHQKADEAFKSLDEVFEVSDSEVEGLVWDYCYNDFLTEKLKELVRKCKLKFLKLLVLLLFVLWVHYVCIGLMVIQGSDGLSLGFF